MARSIGAVARKNPDERYQNYDELIQDLERMRPAKLPKAGRIPRMLAWCVDATIVYLLFAFVAVSVTIFGMLQKFEGNPLLGFVLSLVFGLFVAIAGSVPLLLASAIQGY